MGKFINLCMQIPNLGTILFYLVFLIAIPAYIFTSGSSDILKYYMPFVVMFAVTLTESGKPNYFKKLYPIPARDLPSFLSSNIINLFALVGILIQAVGVALYYNNIQLGVMIGTIAFEITFPIARTVLPFFIREGDISLRENTRFLFPGNWHKYTIGFAFIIALLGLEYVLVNGIGAQMTKAVMV